MRKNYLMKSISIILMLLAMMFSCTQVCENIDSGNSNSNNTNQGGNTGGGGGQTADSITITLIGTDGKEFDKFDIKIGEEIQLPADVERFVCWNTKADGRGESYKGKIKFNKDTTLYLIVLAENAYTITYELDGGVNDKTNPLFFTADDKITLKNPSKDGYRFSGWYETADFSGNAVKGWAAGDKKANVTLYAKWRAFDDKVLAEDGTGVYSYSVCIDALDGRKDYPDFSIFLMTDGQIESMTSDGGKWVEKSEFFEATKTEPVYQIGSYGRMGADTTKTGDYAVWGRTPINGKLEYYEGISASIKGTALSITVDMTQLVNVELKSYKNGEETYMTDDDTVILSNYKPYISLNLDYDYDDGETYNSYIVELDLDNTNERLYGMNSGALFPTNLKEDAPAVPTFYDLTYLFSSISQYPVELKNNVYTFVAPEKGEVMFGFINFNPYAESAESYPVFPIQIGGEAIESLNKNFPLDDIYNPKNYNFQIKSGVLTAGNMYTITLNVRGNNEAYVKVSEVKPTAIKINSTAHKTSYYQGDDINVANLTVEATIADGTKFTVNVTADMISGFDSSKLGKQTLTITLDDCTATYSVEVKDVVVTELNVTADELVDTIKGLTAGEYYFVKVSGVMTSEIMRDLQDEMEDSYGNKDVARIALDLGNTTGLTEMSYSFYYCHELTSIVFPEGMTSIPSFNNCSNLTSITIPASVENVSSIRNCKKFTTFEVAENNEYFSTSTDGKILYSKDKTVLFSYPSASGDVTIPNGVTSISYRAFSYCNSLTSVTIPDSVTSIGYDAFENCENLESVTIGAGVTSISSDSFSGCSSLTSIEVDSANPKYSSDGKMLLSKDKTTLLMYPSATGDVTIPNGVIEIGDYAFQDCDSLTSVTIPDSVTTIGYEAFYDCENLESVTLGKNVKTIGSEAFEYCYKLASIEIPDGVTSIGSDAFYACRSLTNVTIPDSVTKIGRYAFSGCEALTSVTFENTNGWYSYDYNTGEFSIDVTDEEQNATYLTDSYKDYYWYRVLTEDVINTNVYSYKLDIEDISTVSGGSPASPTFSVVLATDEQVSNGYASYDYRISAYGNMKIADTSQTGSYVVYGQDVQNGEYQYYTGIAATVTDTTFELIVDMSKIKKTEFYNVQGDEYIDFTEYKPYVIALGTYENDPYNSVDGSGMMKMTSGAKFPTNPTKGAPKVPDCYDLKYIAGCATNWTHELMDGNSFNFTYTYYPDEDDGYNTGYDRFAFTNGGWDFKAGGVRISSLGVPFKLEVGGSDITFDSYLLTEGNEYTISLSVDSEDEAYVMVTEEKAEAISVNSTNHKTTYDVGDYLDVSGLTIEVTKEDGTKKTVYVTESMVDGFYSYTAGTQTLTITYGGCITTFDVTVVANVSLTGIEIVSDPDKTSYIVGEDLDLSGLEIEATYSDGSTSYVDVSLDMVSGFDSSVVGTQTLTVTYRSYTDTFTVEVEKQIVYHTITFNANGGSGTMAPRTIGETSSYYFNIASDFTAPTGYGFSHWNTKADGSGTTYEWGDYYPILEDITLYAQWEKVESSLDVELPESTRFSISQTVNGDKVTFECSSYSYYNSYAWFIDGVKQTSTSSEMTVDTSTMEVGSYTVMLTVKYDGKYWSENATLTIKK